MTGNWWWAPGEWTDDAAKALVVAESIAERGLLDERDLARRYIEWAANDGKGIGLATSRARLGAKDADQASARASAHHEAGLLAAGNGTVMGVTTSGLTTDDIERAAGTARQGASLTHGDPVAGGASAAMCAVLIAECTGRDPLAVAAARAARTNGSPTHSRRPEERRRQRSRSLPWGRRRRVLDGGWPSLSTQPPPRRPTSHGRLGLAATPTRTRPSPAPSSERGEECRPYPSGGSKALHQRQRIERAALAAGRPDGAHW
jgi:hypothetical protein